jgi:hypothetical protein
MLIVENKVKTFFRLLWKKTVFILCVIGMLIWILLEILVCIDFDKLSSKDENITEKLETRIEVLEDIHNIKEQTE